MARPGSRAQDAVMLHTGTTLARAPRMNDRLQVPAPSLLSPVRMADPPAAAEEDQGRDDDSGRELDKYDISTLACTD